MDREKIKPLYWWLIEDKNYSELEAEETILRYDLGLEMPLDVLKDIKEWSSLFIQAI